MIKKNILIIGAGISGLSIAYHLGLENTQDVLVIDKGYFASGATGRCGAGVRQQWATKQNCLLTQWSMKFFEKAHKVLDYEDLELKQEGYLIVATTDDEVTKFKKNVKLQNELGIETRYLSVQEALDIVPHLNPDNFLGATFNQSDGHLNPFKTSEAFYLAGKRLGVTYSFHEEVLSIQSVTEGFIVTTTKNKYLASKVINAAGGYSKEVGQMVGIDLPIYSEKHEILATEPIERFQGPMVMSFNKNIYIQQVPHGPFVMGRSEIGIKPSHDISSSRSFTRKMSQTVMDLLPKVGELRVVRTWAGSYNMSPDRQPIIGKTPVENYYVACGFSGHGFMLAPIVGKLMSEIILEKETTMTVETLSLERFKNNQEIIVEQFVV
ncbi:MAG TPA: FAD-binding oxidoreductase [Erysipelothrix sp.]|nr:FAD-binding oxidoreductase [Erysipelothrix sp.]